jgi:hypothetical protein
MFKNHAKQFVLLTIVAVALLVAPWRVVSGTGHKQSSAGYSLIFVEPAAVKRDAKAWYVGGPPRVEIDATRYAIQVIALVVFYGVFYTTSRTKRMP